MNPPVLAVDDEADFCATYQRLLWRLDCRVIATGTLAQALAIVEREPLRLVIADVRLPDGDGLDVVRAAARTTPAPTPAVVITGLGSPEHRAAALAAGAVGYLSKPFAVPDFLALVGQALGRSP